ncbi:MAG: hypothetical protein H0T84_03090 [Tatlockia sp.]|nr:hypothetical protein [Tatlockia sp.]
MQQKSELTDLTNDSLEIVKGFNWYEKAILEMIRAKGIEYNLYALCSVFYAIKLYQSEDKDIGEIIYIIDQFARRLETVDTSKNKIHEIALICAIVGMKAASDLAVWNIDFLNPDNNCFNFSTCETISLYTINELERQHLVVLDFVLGFSKTSKMDERFQIIMKYLDLKGMQTIEKELQKLEFSGEGAKLGSHIQKAILKKTSETNPGFFRKGSKKSKTDDDSVPSEKPLTMYYDGFRCQSTLIKLKLSF